MWKSIRIFCYAAILTLCGAELVVRLISPVPRLREISIPHMYLDDALLGYRLVPGITTDVHAWDDTKELFHVRYKIDGAGRRDVEIPNRAGRRKHFVILGGSTVFGKGLSDNETLGYFLGQITSHYRPYNYAVDGYGPQGAYALAENGALASQVFEQEGITILFFQMLNRTGGHVQTLLGSFELLLEGWGRHLSFYDFSQSGHPTPRGRLEEFSPIKFHLFRALQNFQVANELYPRLFGLPAGDIRLTARFLRQLNDRVVEAKPRTRFIVAFHPFSDRTRVAELKSILISLGIEVFDYSTLIEEADLDDYVAFNQYIPHPNAKLNTRLSDKLKVDLSLD